MGVASSMSLPRPFGPYELVRQLGVGGMAEVFVARARSVAGFEKIVALKTIHASLSDDPEFARLLVEEANITAQLSHRNIVQVIDLGQVDGTHYIAMEYVDGLDLARLLTKLRERGQVASPRLAAFVMREVCDGLEHAHRKHGPDGKPLKIVHRDVSPPNILLSAAGEVKLTDFGIAKAAMRASSTQAGVVKGKYAYMAPEQARAGAIDLRVDVFAAGCVLYELATGRPVYEEASLPVLLERVSRAVFEPPERVRPDLPAPLVAVLKRALAVEPAQRYPTARAMADELNAFLFKQPPNPEIELAQLVSTVQDGQRASMPPIAGTSLLDDDSDDATQIESMASMRQKMALPTQRPPPPAAVVAAASATTSAPASPSASKAAAPSTSLRDEPTRTLKRGDFTAPKPPEVEEDDGFGDDNATMTYNPTRGAPLPPPASSSAPTVPPSANAARVRSPGISTRAGGVSPSPALPMPPARAPAPPVATPALAPGKPPAARPVPLASSSPAPSPAPPAARPASPAAPAAPAASSSLPPRGAPPAVSRATPPPSAARPAPPAAPSLPPPAPLAPAPAPAAAPLPTSGRAQTADALPLVHVVSPSPSLPPPSLAQPAAPLAAALPQPAPQPAPAFAMHQEPASGAFPAPPGAWDPAEQQLVEARQKRAVLIAGIFATVALVTLAVVLVTVK